MTNEQKEQIQEIIDILVDYFYKDLDGKIESLEVLTFILDICKEFDYVPRFSYCRPIEDEENTDYNLKTTVTLTPKTTEP